MMEEPEILTRKQTQEKPQEIKERSVEAQVNPPATAETETIKEVQRIADQEQELKIREELLAKYEGGDAFPVKKFDGLFEILQRLRGNLRRQEENRVVASIDIDKLSGAVARLVSALGQKEVNTGEVAEALNLIAGRIQEGEGGKRTMPRNIDIAIDDYKRVIANLRMIGDETLSLRTSVQKNEEILRSLSRIRDIADEQAGQIARLASRLKGSRY